MLRSKKDVDKHVRELLAKIKNEQDRKARGYNIARLYYNVGEYETARRYLAEFICLRPNSPEAHRLLGEIFESLGQREKAVLSFVTSYEIANTQKDLVLKICELYAVIDNNDSVRLHWAEEGERLFPLHNSIIRLRECLLLNKSHHSKEDLENLYLNEIEASPVSLSIHLKLLKLYKEWAREDSNKLTDAYHYIIKIESQSLFLHSYEWYHNVFSIIELYENWKKPHKDKHLEELVLSILDRYVSQSFATSCGSALTASCSVDEATKKLRKFDHRLTDALKILGSESLCGQHMINQYYFHMATLLSIKAKNVNLVQKEFLLGLLLIHSCGVTKNLTVSAESNEIERIKSSWYNVGCHRVSQSGHILTQLAAFNGGEAKYFNRLRGICDDLEIRKTIRCFVFGATSGQERSFLENDENFAQNFSLMSKRTLLLCDQEVSLFCSSNLREIVWLFLQYNSGDSSVNDLKPRYSFHNFHFFRGLPFSSNLLTNAPETLSHLDLVAFIVATAFCHQANNSFSITGTCSPVALCLNLHTVEQDEWWRSAAALCSSSNSKKLNRLRSVLQNGLESIRYIGHHVLPLPLTVHLARYFTSCLAKSQEDGKSASELDALGERAEYYWSKVLNLHKKSGQSYGSTVKSRLFTLPRSDSSENENNEFEEAQLFVVERLITKGQKQEAIKILTELNTPQALFKRAMLYKEEAKDLVRNSNLNSLSVESRNEYVSLLTQARDAFIQTRGRQEVIGSETSDTLKRELNEELACIERSLAAASLDDIGSEVSLQESPSFHPVLELTNGNTFGGFASQFSSTPFRVNASKSRITRQEVESPSPERLDAQVRHLTEIQQNTIKNIENHNAALRAQNEALLQTCQTMASEFKENVAFYKSFLERKTETDSLDPLVSQMKELQLGLKGLQVEVRSLSSEVADLRSSYSIKTNPMEMLGATSTAADNLVSPYLSSPAAMQDVYNTYLGYYNQSSVASPLVAPNSMFSSFPPPFIPPRPTSRQDLAYLPSLPSAIKAEQTLPTSDYAASNYQNICSSPVGHLSRTPSTMKNVQGKGPANGSAPPHSFQINLPSSEALLTSTSDDKPIERSSPAFTTVGLLSTVPAPVYSAITTLPLTEKETSKTLLGSTQKNSSVSGISPLSQPEVETYKENLQHSLNEPPFSSTYSQLIPETNTSQSLLESSVNKSAAGLFSGTSNATLSFDDVAAKTFDKAVFQTKDTKAFQPKPLFGSSHNCQNESANDGDKSKDEVEEYEPQVDFKPVIPMPDLVEVKTGEEDEEKLFCERAKLFRYDVASKEWKERGVGELKLLRNRQSMKVRILMRREQTHKVCANHFIKSDMKISAMANSEKAMVWAANDFADEEMKYEKFAARFKNQQQANDFKNAVESTQKNLSLTVQQPISKETCDTNGDVSKAASLSEMFKQTAGSWECSGCLIINKPDVNVCPACSTTKPEDSTVVEKPAAKGIPDISGSVFKSASLNEMFKQTAGSWECSGCLMINKPDVISCPACLTPKPGCEQDAKSSSTVSGSNNSSAFGTKTFSFGPSTSAASPFSSFSFGLNTAPTTSTTTTTTFSFGLPPSVATSSTALINSTVAKSVIFSPKDELSTTTTNTSMITSNTFAWRPVDASKIDAGPTGEFQQLNGTHKSIFGSPGKHDFSFSGVKSPKAKDTSVCESEDGVVEEEDYIYFEPVIPLPDKIEVVTGEEEETSLFTHRAKLFRIYAGEWKERGLGDLKILQHNKTKRVRLLMRREQVLKICLNHNLDKEMEFRMKDDKTYFWVATDFSDIEPSKETFAIRFKTPDIAKSFIYAIKRAQTLEFTTDNEIASADKGDGVSKSTSLSDMFKQTAGSWECSGCLIINKPDIISCPACVTSKPGCEQETKSNSFTFGAKALSSVSSIAAATPLASLSFGLSAAPSKTTASTTSFTFGLPSNVSTSTIPINPETDADEVQVILELKVSPELLEKARKLELPDNFYLYLDAKPCSGCIGCDRNDIMDGTLGTSEDANLVGKSAADEVAISVMEPSSTFSSSSQSYLFGALSLPAPSTTPSSSTFKAPLPAISTLFSSKTSMFGSNPANSTPPIFGMKSFESSQPLFGGLNSADAKPLFRSTPTLNSAPISFAKPNGSLNSPVSAEGVRSSVQQSFFGSAPSVSSANVSNVSPKDTSLNSTTHVKLPEQSLLLNAAPSGSPYCIFGSSMKASSDANPSEPLPLFGTAPSICSPSIFGNVPEVKPLFGAKLSDPSQLFGVSSVNAQIGLGTKLEEKPISSTTSPYDVKTSDPSPLFSAAPSIGSSSIFGSNSEEKSLFGAKPSESSPFFSAATSIGSSSIFGEKPEDKLLSSTSATFNVKAAEPTPLFGASSFTSPSIFGRKPEDKTLFGAKIPESSSLFGASSISSPSIFGRKSEDKPLFDGKPSEPSPLFGVSSGSSSTIFEKKSEDKSLNTTTNNVPATVFDIKLPESAPLFGATAHVGSNSIFGGNPNNGKLGGTPTDQYTSIFGPKSGEASRISIFSPESGANRASIFSQNTLAANDKSNTDVKDNKSNSKFKPAEPSSIFGTPNYSETSNVVPLFNSKYANGNSIFSPSPGKTSFTFPIKSEASDSNFGVNNEQNLARAIDLTAATSNGTSDTKSEVTNSIFNSKTGVNGLFTSKASESNSLFSHKTTKANSCSSKTSVLDITKTSLLSSPASAMSFGDVAKNDAAPFKSSSSIDSSAWVSKPLFGGNSVKSPERDENDEDYDPHYEPVIDLPDLIEIKTGEEGWQEIFSQRAKLFRYEVATKQWKERGIGEFKIQFEPTLKRYRLLQRREQIHKLSCNHYLTTSMDLEPMLTSEVAWCWFATDYSESEGEALKLAVKFKTKEIALKFQEVFNECKQKLSKDPPSTPSVQHQTLACSERADLSAAASFTTALADSSHQHEDDDDSDTHDGSSQQQGSEDYEDDEDEEDYEQALIIAEMCTLSKFEDGKWQVMCKGEMCIYYDSETNGARIIVTSSDDERMCNTLITLQSTMALEEDTKFRWNALDELSYKPEFVHLKAEFTSSESAQHIKDTFLEGKEYAARNGIEDKDILLFYGLDPSTNFA